MAKTVTQIKINRRGAAELLKSPEVRALVRPHAERVAARAKASAPVDSGEYQEKIGVESDTTDRVVERVVARAAHSLIVEAKTGNLARALGAEGG